MLLSLLAAALCLGTCLPLFMHYKKSLRPVLATIYKCLGTACALIIALTAAIRLDPMAWLCVAALLLHMVADGVLEFNFPAGAGFFIAGHIFYFACFMQRFPFTATHVICFVLLLAGSLFLLYRWRKQAGKQLPLLILYAVMLCALCAVCVAGGVAAYSLSGILISIAGALLFLSDSILCYRLLFPAPKVLSWIIMITYYLAQLLFASTWLI